MLRFEWSLKKAAINLRKHRVSFDEAATVFEGRHQRVYDIEHSGTEDREIALGFSVRLRLLVVVIYEQEDETIRIISARRANRAEGLRFFKENHGPAR